MRGVLKPQAERIANDAYYTPQPLADAICWRLQPLFGGLDSILEPHTGGGAFYHAVQRVWPRTTLCTEDIGGGDWAEPGTLGDGFCLVVGNPPYLSAEKEVRTALSRVRPVGHVAFLLRLSFLAGQKRRALYEQHPLRFLIPITPRPSFTPDGKTDASEYAVFVWERGYAGLPVILSHLVWRR